MRCILNVSILQIVLLFFLLKASPPHTLNGSVYMFHILCVNVNETSAHPIRKSKQYTERAPIVFICVCVQHLIGFFLSSVLLFCSLPLVLSYTHTFTLAQFSLQIRKHIEKKDFVAIRMYVNNPTK